MREINSNKNSNLDNVKKYNLNELLTIVLSLKLIVVEFYQLSYFIHLFRLGVYMYISKKDSTFHNNITAFIHGEIQQIYI